MKTPAFFLLCYVLVGILFSAAVHNGAAFFDIEAWIMAMLWPALMVLLAALGTIVALQSLWSAALGQSGATLTAFGHSYATETLWPLALAWIAIMPLSVIWGVGLSRLCGSAPVTEKNNP